MELELRQYEPSQAFGPQNPTSGTPEAAPRPPGPARRDPRPDQRPLLRRLDPVADARLGQRARGPAGGAAGHHADRPAVGRDLTAAACTVDSSARSSRSAAPRCRLTQVRPLVRLRDRPRPQPGRPGDAALHRAGVRRDGPAEVRPRHRGDDRDLPTATSRDLFKGLVTGVSLDQEVHGLPVTELTVTVDDAAYKLGQDTQNTAFLNSSVLRRHHQDGQRHRPAVRHRRRPTQAHPYLLQTGTNLAYLDWIVGRCGMVWWVDYGKLKVKKPAPRRARSPPTSSSAHDLHPAVDARLRAAHRQGDRHRVGRRPSRPPSPTSPTRRPRARVHPRRASSPAGRRRPAAGRKVSGASPLTADEAKLVSETMLAESTSAAVTTRGTCLANGAIKPVTKVKVHERRTGVGHLPRHPGAARLRPRRASTPTSRPARSGPRASSTCSRRRSRAPGATISGLMVGVVTNINDTEGKLGPGQGEVPDDRVRHRVRVGPGRHARRRARARRGLPARGERRGAGRLRAGRHPAAGRARRPVQQQERPARPRTTSSQRRGRPTAGSTRAPAT